MILVLGGTTEAKQILEKLIDENRKVLMSTAYEFAEDYIPDNPLIKHISGRLNREGLQALINDEDIRVVIDATHPYALEISKNAKEACNETGIKYIRLERKPSRIDNLVDAADIYYATSYEEAAEIACRMGEIIFLAIGSNNAAVFKSSADELGRKAYIRVLPDERSVKKCIDMGFGKEEIVAGIGPFSYKENYDLWKRLSIDVMVTKDSGDAGGFIEKLRAATDLGVKVVVIRRPEADDEATSSIDEVINTLNKYIPSL